MKERKKMSRQTLIDLFPAYSPGKAVVGKATQRGFVHAHNPTWKPPKAELTPAQWHKAQRAKRNAQKAKK